MFSIYFFIIKVFILAVGGLIAYAGYKNWSWMYMIAVPKVISKSLGKDMTRIALIGTGVVVMLLSVLWIL